MKNIEKRHSVLTSGYGLFAVSGIGITAIASGMADARAHGFVGDRFFPPTIATDDPFATDELLLPAVSYFKSAGSPATATTDGGFEFDKEIFPHFALGVSGDYLHVKPDGEPST